tara:strand:- start:1470 stop:2279 length:810 start_codon:yes stop_codon:yes gene_type:complete
MRNNIIFVFDLDKTIGYFTQIAIFLEAIEDYLNRKFTLKEFFKLLDIYPEIFRPDIFPIFKYIKTQKKKKKNIRVLIYTNNIGPKSWVHNIKKYIEHKLHFKLFNRTIAAWKVGNIVYEKCRTTHNKTYKDLLKCGRLKKNSKICFFDDQRHPDMINKNVTYLYLYEYQHDILFENMIKRFLKSSLSKMIKKSNINEFKEYIMDFAQNDPLGFKYIEKPYKKNYNKKYILSQVKNFIKQDHFKNKSRKKRRKLRIQKKQHKTKRIPISS